MSFLISALSLVFVISLIVLFHEAGHYATARMAGVGVNEFAIGFGPKVANVRRGETDYAIRAVPLGGFVDLIGMEENPEANPAERELEFAGKSAFWRIAILFAGSFMNFVLAYLLLVVVNGFFGQPVQPYASLPVVARVMADAPAARAGFAAGDELLAVDGTPVASWFHFRSLVETRLGKSAEVRVRRGSAEVTLAVTPEAMAGDKTKGRIGLTAEQPPVLGEVFPGSPASEAGMRAGDQLVTVDGIAVPTYGAFERALDAAAKGGATVALRVKRLTGEVDLKVTVHFAEIGVRPPYAAMIGGISGGGAAERAGVKPGETVVDVDGAAVTSWHHMVEIFSANAGRTLAVTLENESGARRTLAIAPQNDGNGIGRVGVTIKTEYAEPLGLPKAFVVAWEQTVDITVKTVSGIWKLVAGAISLEYVSGPVGIAKIVGSQAREGWAALFGITALLSINIGLLNLFPIPGLDGSRIVFVAIEVLRRKRLSTRIEEMIHTAGFVLLIGLIILVTYKDIAKLLR